MTAHDFQALDEERGGCAQPFCRICLGDSEELECGELLSPCNCTGSLRYVHSKCFDIWTRNSPTKQDGGPLAAMLLRLVAFTGYQCLYMRVRCELCGSIYRVGKVRLHCILRWMLVLALLSTLIVCSSMVVRTNSTAWLFRSSLSSAGHRITRAVESVPLDEHTRHATSICFLPYGQQFAYCFDISSNASSDYIYPQRALTNLLPARPHGA